MEEPAESDRPDDDRPRWRRILDVFGFLQVIVLPLALLARWLPSKGGGTLDLAPQFIDTPTYIESVFVNVIVLNLFLFVIGIVLVVGAKVLEARDSSA